MVLNSDIIWDPSVTQNEGQKIRRHDIKWIPAAVGVTIIVNTELLRHLASVLASPLRSSGSLHLCSCLLPVILAAAHLQSLLAVTIFHVLWKPEERNHRKSWLLWLCKDHCGEVSRMAANMLHFCHPKLERRARHRPGTHYPEQNALCGPYGSPSMSSGGISPCSIDRLSPLASLPLELWTLPLSRMLPFPEALLRLCVWRR